MDDICGWLEKVVEKQDGQIKMLVMQYIDAISQFTDGRSVRVMDKSLEILSESVEFFETGLQIEKTMMRVKVNLIRNVFDNFKDEINTIAEHYGLVLENEISYYSYENTKHDKFYDCYSTFPGLNYVVKNAHFKNKNLQMWFRVEVEHNLFAGL